jgi:uncharacterized membrane protein
MTTFTAWKFDTEGGAAQAEKALTAAQSDGLVEIHDHAVVTWPKGADKPEIHHDRDSIKRGTGWGALWGMVIGALFFVPVFGGIAGAAIGALSKATEDVGIRKEDLERIRTELTEGTSALFAVTESGDLDRLGERFHGMNSTLIATNLTEGERAILLETFGNRGVHRPQG